ncbi:putative F420-dependent oxidoreductase [Saccharothrix tamanrassetensis]|uniref:Putative F420-dependent oxidoreductase n=1 Tax=Saccharothrix tamanrassetensis TaxID=1051531 RepID=A0A841CJ98_9PSEU|nr:LLM class flavin-dependent oxidoreductase [Saccharothrix tamanrassetensis]MBB5957053.1 putative F420-dependent oxidoreductase [Saccharothrix tamanrassetensis]
MELVTTLPAHTDLADVAHTVRRIERLGFDTVHIPETVHDSLSVALLALEHTTWLTVRTSMTLAFPRSPMTVAYAAWDLARYSGGRFQLGLATQVRGNIVGRFSVPWSAPAERLADYIGALRAIFDAFAQETPLAYEGTHYRFDRLQPYFNPGPSGVDPPQIWTGGVNRRMCVVAGAHADGFVTHATNSHPSYLDEQLLPALAEGAADRTDGGPRVIVVSKCVTGSDRTALEAARNNARTELAFLYSTPAYRPTLAMLGHEHLGERLTDLVRDERWAELPSVLTDQTMADLIPQGVYAEIPEVLESWYRGRCDGLAISLPDNDQNDPAFTRMLAAVRDIPAR